jgi:hypothetical protein
MTTMKVFEALNHASIKSSYNGHTIITDPWYVSNAFGGWYQNPSPKAKDIHELMDQKKEIGIVISHGHDDHCDDWFIKNHLMNKDFFCTKFKTPGLERRLDTDLNVKTTPIADGVKYGDFFIRQFINPDFTHYDAVITIETPEFLIIHANDNWHEWPEKMLEDIKLISRDYNKNQIFLLIQFGIADCFPINYPNFTDTDVDNLIKERFNNYMKQTLSNAKKLNLQNIYYYANQSRYNYNNNLGASLYDKAQRFLESNCKLNFEQLVPGVEIGLNHEIISKNNDNSISIFDFQLKSLEQHLNQKLSKSINNDNILDIRLLEIGQEIEKNAICFVADKSIWNRIMVGELNLESIIIGGCGMIYKPSQNISEYHHILSKQAYVIQAMIKKQGLNFYRNI